MVGEYTHQQELDLAWVAGKSADLTRLMHTLGLAPDVDALEEQRMDIEAVSQAIIRRFGYKMGRKIIRRIEKTTGKLELPKEA